MNRFAFFILTFLVFAIENAVFSQNPQKLDSLELCIKYADSENDKINILINLTKELQNNNPNLALEYVQEALSLSEKIKFRKGQVDAKILMAEIFWSMTDFNAALDYVSEAKIGAEKDHLISELALCHRLMGLIYVDLGNYKKASENFFNSLKLFEELQDKVGIAKAMSSIGYVYFDQKNYDKALEYYFSSLNLAKEANDKQGISRGLNNIAAVYGSKDEYTKAKRYIEEAILINEELGNQQWVGINKMNLGLTFQKLQNQDSALMFFQEALHIFTELENVMWQSKCNLNIGSYYLSLNDYPKAFEIAKTVVDEAKKHQLKKIVLDAYELYRDTYLSKGDTISAYNYTLLIIQAKDSLDSEKNKTLLSKLELQYQFEKKEQEMKIQQQRNNFFFIIFMISLGFALVVFFLLWARQRVKSKNVELEKKGLEEKLEFKNKEFTIHVMSLMKKNEMLTNMTDKLIQVAEEAIKDETKTAIKRIALELQKSTDHEIWDEFELRFSQVHGDFYDKLLKRFPNLSPSEQKLCAFLRLNMTTKEISELTGQSVSTLETARYRLRKKLDLANSQINLITFLSQI